MTSSNPHRTRLCFLLVALAGMAGRAAARDHHELTGSQVAAPAGSIAVEALVTPDPEDDVYLTWLAYDKNGTFISLGNPITPTQHVPPYFTATKSAAVTANVPFTFAIWGSGNVDDTFWLSPPLNELIRKSVIAAPKELVQTPKLILDQDDFVCPRADLPTTWRIPIAVKSFGADFKIGVGCHASFRDKDGNRQPVPGSLKLVAAHQPLRAGTPHKAVFELDFSKTPERPITVVIQAWAEDREGLNAQLKVAIPK